MKKEVGDNLSAKRGNWSFDDINQNEFEAHVSKSVPGYETGHKYISFLSDYFISSNSKIYDIGCSKKLLKIIWYNYEKMGHFIGIEPVGQFENLENNTSK